MYGIHYTLTDWATDSLSSSSTISSSSSGHGEPCLHHLCIQKLIKKMSCTTHVQKIGYSSMNPNISLAVRGRVKMVTAILEDDNRRRVQYTFLFTVYISSVWMRHQLHEVWRQSKIMNLTSVFVKHQKNLLNAACHALISSIIPFDESSRLLCNSSRVATGRWVKITSMSNDATAELNWM